MYPNVQAYDRGVMFNPDGRLFQVEYAKEAVRKGATSIGIVGKDSVVLVAHKNINDPLAVASTIQKVFRIDSQICATYSGMVSDGLHIIDTARSNTQNHRMLFDEIKSIESLSKNISAYMMQATQYGGEEVARELGCELVGKVMSNKIFGEMSDSGIIPVLKDDSIRKEFEGIIRKAGLVEK